MNSLSWFLYLANVVDNVGNVFVLFAILSGIAMFVWSFASAAYAIEGGQDAQRVKHFLRFIPWIFVITSFLVAVTPSRDTVYLIAASEEGEMVVNTPEAKEVMSDLKEILNIQLGKLKE